MKRLIVLVVLVCASFVASDAKAQSLTITGPCPGIMTFEVNGAAPFARIAYIYSTSTGSWAVPPGFPCAGLITGLGAPVNLGAFAEADAAGDVAVSATIPPGFCGTRFVQALDLLVCSSSPVVLIP